MQVATEYCDCLAAQLDAIALECEAERAAARGDLPGDELGAAELAAPVRREAAVRGAGDRILVDAGAGREEARHEIPPRGRRATRDHHAAYRQRPQAPEVGTEIGNGAFAVELDEVVEAALADVVRRGAKRLGESGGRIGGSFRRRWKVELDPVGERRCRQEAALGVEPRRFTSRQVTVLPERVRAGERRVTTKR